MRNEDPCRSKRDRLLGWHVMYQGITKPSPSKDLAVPLLRLSVRLGLTKLTMGRQSSKQVVALVLTWLAISRGAMSKEMYVPRVSSTSGTIIGHQAPDNPDTFEFLGIRYGKAPVGELRFAPPQRYTAPAHAFYNASTWVSSTLSHWQTESD